ncbi:unnamed protein product [Urochloa decumbens]|uniref:Uncharacterized protein n=1 Tax=Urochloa decumbens TaxID=240449 RepID=A0ABC9CVN7_9POAL
MEPDLEAGLTTTRAPAGDGATATPLPPHPLKIIIGCVVAAVVGLGFVWFVACDPLAPCYPTFSVDIAGVDGLDGPAEPAPTVNPAFNLTLHGVSRRYHIGSVELCQESGTVSVSYAGAVLAWSRVPKFCVPAQEQRLVEMVKLDEPSSQPSPCKVFTGYW